jgi:hypothetical protein
MSVVAIYCFERGAYGMKLLIWFAGLSFGAGFVFGVGWTLYAGPWWAKIWMILALAAAGLTLRRYL